jgi:hypothetical protein
VKPCVPREPPSSRERRDGGSEPPGGRSPPPAADRAAPRRASLTLGAAGAWWPSWSSKPVRRCNPPLGRFDSGAAPSYLWPQNQPHRSRLVGPSRLVSGATRSENTCRLGAWDHRTTIAHGCFLRLSRAMCVEMATRRARKEVASAAPTACREGVQVRHSRRCQARAGQPAPAHLATRRRSRRHDRAGTVRGSVARAAALVRTDRIVRDRFQRANRYEPWHTPTEATINRRSGRAS